MTRGAGLLAAAMVLTACGGGSSGSVRSAVSTTTTAATSPVTSGTGGSVNIGIICSAPTDAANAVVNAWKSGDRAAATRCGSPAAVDALFARAVGASAWVLQRCVGTACSFASPQGTLRLTVSGSDAAGWIVARVQFGR